MPSGGPAASRWSRPGRRSSGSTRRRHGRWRWSDRSSCGSSPWSTSCASGWSRTSATRSPPTPRSPARMSCSAPNRDRGATPTPPHPTRPRSPFPSSPSRPRGRVAGERILGDAASASLPRTVRPMTRHVWRLPMLLLVPVLVVAAIAVQRDEPTSTSEVRADRLVPVAPAAGADGSTWYCAAGSATGRRHRRGCGSGRAGGGRRQPLRRRGHRLVDRRAERGGAGDPTSRRGAARSRRGGAVIGRRGAVGVGDRRARRWLGGRRAHRGGAGRHLGCAVRLPSLTHVVLPRRNHSSRDDHARQPLQPLPRGGLGRPHVRDRGRDAHAAAVPRAGRARWEGRRRRRRRGGDPP